MSPNLSISNPRISNLNKEQINECINFQNYWFNKMLLNHAQKRPFPKNMYENI